MSNFRELPSVDQVLRQLGDLDAIPSALIKNEIRTVLKTRREALQTTGQSEASPVADTVRTRLQNLFASPLRRVINATGVILHTNLGRAPLPAFELLSGYSNLEFDLATGQRGKRDAHLAPLLERLLGRAAIAVNNNAAAVYLALNEVAAGHEVIVSRGELIEIGDGFRIPDIMLRAGVVLREVGSTNRTRLSDYEDAITERTRLILLVHPSNFHITGFTERPPLREVAALGRQHGIPVYQDLGSGCFLSLADKGIQEPLVSETFAAGVNLASFSCDKLMGGPQAGIIAGDAELIQRIRRNPMYRAFRLDKLIIQALETTLRHLLLEDWSKIPTLHMIFTPLADIHARAERVASQLCDITWRLREADSPIGGGSTPDQALRTWVLELELENASSFATILRQQPMPVIARIEHDKLILDMRTVAEKEEPWLVQSVKAAAAEECFHGRS
ncbi:MAG TPA: L-seryl-tRNA(Sec) selenium transferase [Bryobacteraceae bacterium]|jgi:L-seryl-tRNA(Ser) seleniumtransferase|nr:L-seryl-tRNA(Sec) selenium transferase [Bryobacteraceae bacterium]